MFKPDLEKFNSMNFFPPAIFVNISAKFGFLNMQSRNDFKNVIFIACKWCKICKYSVYSMVVSYSYFPKEEKNAFGLNIWFMLFCQDFKFVVIHVFFSAKSETQNFRVHKKMFFSKSDLNIWIWTLFYTN